MTNCWSEGAMRAYLDRELAAEDMKAVAAHLGECSACDELCAELAGRAARVFGLLELLPEPEAKVVRPGARMRPVPSRVPSRWLWPGAAVALAAGLAIASYVLPKKDAPAPQPLARVPEAPISPMAVHQELAPAGMPTVRPASMSSSKGRLPRRAKKDEMNYFVALDDQPIESGVIMRVDIQPGNTQADIVFDPDGRARAIRLVGNKY
jgi:hypothetical protein